MQFYYVLTMLVLFNRLFQLKTALFVMVKGFVIVVKIDCKLINEKCIIVIYICTAKHTRGLRIYAIFFSI